ncbi:MAG TPA: UDP-N-acetylmuramate dehydrogenase [Patescibacteria group bacterium]|nr:UDP-N-acetylmuramate dehydrogenase [Patescibacteria group bacterium]
MLNIEENKVLSLYTTFNIGGLAKYFVEVSDEHEAREAISWAKHKDLEILIIGQGSNMLLPDEDFLGLVIKNNIKGIREKKVDNNYIIIETGSGEIWDDVVKYSVDREYWGIENLSYIPGTIGASPVQNIGAYGVELKDVFYSLRAINFDSLETETFEKHECNFAYRSSIFKKQLKSKVFITSVSLKLSLEAKPQLNYGSLGDIIKKDIYDLKPNDISKAIIEIRKSKLPEPEKWGNSGSFFQNPEIEKEHFEKLKVKYPDIKYYNLDNGLIKVPAGWLIEEVGWKGKSLGKAGVWGKQALILINLGGASSKDIKKLAETIIADVKEKFDIELVPEVNIY